jgi:uncharacterized membrane protein
MTKKSLIVLLIFVIIAGAVAGAFVFLNQQGAGESSATPGMYNSSVGVGFAPAAVQPCLVRPAPEPETCFL